MEGDSVLSIASPKDVARSSLQGEQFKVKSHRVDVQGEVTTTAICVVPAGRVIAPLFPEPVPTGRCASGGPPVHELAAPLYPESYNTKLSLDLISRNLSGMFWALKTSVTEVRPLTFTL